MEVGIPVWTETLTDRPIKLRAGTLLGDLVKVVPQQDACLQLTQGLGYIRRTKIQQAHPKSPGDAGDEQVFLGRDYNSLG